LKHEWADDQMPSMGRLDEALDEAKAKGWAVVDMNNDWKLISLFEERYQGRICTAS
jgi:hypothetical protein